MSVTAVIFGNQLYREHPALRDADQILMVESDAKLRELYWHRKKLVFVLSAMRHYAAALRAAGRVLDYRAGAGRFREALADHIAEYNVTRIVVVEPSEYAAMQAVGRWAQHFPQVQVEILPETVNFTCNRATFERWANDQRGLLLERFYRWQRTRLDILMEGKEPAGARWNFDSDNRESAASLPRAPEPNWSAPDDLTRAVIEYVEKRFPDTWGEAGDFRYPVTNAEAAEWLDDFIEQRLPNFGPWEDAMDADQQFLFHGMTAMLFNIGLLDPLYVAQRVELAYREGKVPLQSAEGYIRQIIGWREYVHGVYWRFMPEYRERNFFNHTLPLPQFFWDGETKMNCLRHTINDVQQNAYTHHIPRLMVISNWANLAGVEPAALTRWFRSVYIDAYDWVMWPNVLGLGLFADGGLMSTKPYVSSAQYIKKMSHGYCDGCAFNPNIKRGEGACPFNVMYWDFMSRNYAKLKNNPRMGVILAAIEKRNDLEELRKEADEMRKGWGAGRQP